MKNFKRKLAGILIFAMVLGIMAPGMTVQAAAQTEKVEFAVTPDYSEELIYLTFPASATAVSFSDTKSAVKDVKGIVEKTTVDGWKAKWEKVEIAEPGTSTGASIDISWVKKNKAANIIFMFEDENGKALHYQGLETPAQETKLKVGLTTASAGSVSVKNGPSAVTSDQTVGDDETGYLFFYVGSEVISPSSIEWRKGTSGTWKATNDGLAGSLALFKAKGATLYFRENTTTEDKDGKIVSTEWPSKEAKFSYKKQANAPKVKVDVTKYTLAVKDTMEYRVVGVDDWTPVANGIKVLNIHEIIKTDAVSEADITVENLYDDNGVYVEVRTKANGTKGTMPSKSTKVLLKSVSPVAITNSTTAALAATGLVVNYTTPYDNTSGISILNYNEADYECMVVASGTAVDEKILNPTNSKDGKWTKIGKGTATREKEVKIKKDLVTGEKEILIRPIGDKKNALLAGNVIRINLTEVETNKLVQKVVKAETKTTGFKVSTYAAATATVTGTAVSGAAATVDVTVEIDIAGLTEADAKATIVTKNVGQAELKKVTVSGNKATVVIELPEKVATTGDLKFKVEGLEVTVKLAIDAAQ